MHITVDVYLDENECRAVLAHIVPETATAVSCSIRAVPGLSEPTGWVRVQYLGRKKDGMVHRRRTGHAWTLTPKWWAALVRNNTELPLRYRTGLQDLVHRYTDEGVL